MRSPLWRSPNGVAPQRPWGAGDGWPKRLGAGGRHARSGASRRRATDEGVTRYSPDDFDKLIAKKAADLMRRAEPRRAPMAAPISHPPELRLHEGGSGAHGT